jgi:hypothetical protein
MLSCVAGRLQSSKPRPPKRRGARMQRQMSFWKAPPRSGDPLVWLALDDEQRAETIAVLARLIAKIAAKWFAVPADRGVEKVDE